MEKKIPPHNRDLGISECISQLVDRAMELGEEDTALVLNVLLAHRIVGADGLFAVVSLECGNVLKTAILKKFPDAEDQSEGE
jgi:hypothetical protein